MVIDALILPEFPRLGGSIFVILLRMVPHIMDAMPWMTAEAACVGRFIWSTLSSCRVSGGVGNQHSEAVGPKGWRVDGRSASELQTRSRLDCRGFLLSHAHIAGSRGERSGHWGFQFRSSLKRSTRVGFLVQAITFAICVTQGDANSLGSVLVITLGSNLRESATGGICETSECIPTDVDERVGHSVTWSFRFPLHAHCHMDYAFIGVGDIAFGQQFAAMR